MLDFAVKLTLTPQQMQRSDVETAPVFSFDGTHVEHGFLWRGRGAAGGSGANVSAERARRKGTEATPVRRLVVGGVEANCTWWSYEMEPIDGGTRLTERWWIVNKTPAVAAAPPEAYKKRVEFTQTMLDQTVAALKAAAES